jgi:hypothetical protein
VRVGGAEAADTASQFVRVEGATRLADGRIVVLTQDETRWFDAQGKYLATSTRKGRGPGETQFAYGMVKLPGDTLAVWQPRPLKAVIVSPAAKVVREEMGVDQKFRAIRRWAECRGYVLADLSQLGCIREDTTPRGPDPGPGLFRGYTRFVRVSRNADSAFHLGRDIGIEQFGVRIDGPRTNFIVHPLHARSYVASGGSPMRIAIATNPEYSVELWRPDGVLERTLTRTNARRAPTKREIDDALPVILKYNARGDAALASRLVAAVPVPAQIPAVSDLAISPEGEVLVGREGQLPSQQVSIVDVFDRRGTFLGELRLPRRFRMLEVGTDYVLGLRLDDDDVPSIEVYRLIKGA